MTTPIVGAAVGHLAQTNAGHFAWEPAAVATTAWATICLAVATFALASTTRSLAVSTGEDVHTSQELARMEAEDREIRDRPLVHVTKKGMETGTLVLDLHNYGNGAAVALHLYPASERWNELEPLETIQLVELGHTEHRVSIDTLAAYHLEHQAASIDNGRWGVRYLNRWRTYSYESFDGAPPKPERFRPFILGQTPLGEGQIW